jgi:hypothetical protein
MGPLAGTDITALAVRMGNARLGLRDGVEPQVRQAPEVGAASGAAAAQPVAARTEAVVVTLSPEAVAKASASSSGSDYFDERAIRMSGAETRKFILNDTLRSIDAATRQLGWMTEQVRKFDETGEVWQPNGNGVLGPPTRELDWAIYGGPAGYINALRERLPGFAKSIDTMRESAAQFRLEYEGALQYANSVE